MTPDHVEPLNGIADATPTPETVAVSGDISAREAVRRVVAELGPDAELGKTKVSGTVFLIVFDAFLTSFLTHLVLAVIRPAVPASAHEGKNHDA